MGRLFDRFKHPRRSELCPPRSSQDLRPVQLIAERKSIAITANAPFSPWEVFPEKATTVAAVDRLVHHATILKMNVDSYRRRAADVLPLVMPARTRKFGVKG
jgi:hypothetical protein